MLLPARGNSWDWRRYERLRTQNLLWHFRKYEDVGVYYFPQWWRRRVLVADGYHINNGYPVLSWEKPALPSYKISVSNEIIVSKTKAEPGETIQLLAPKENFIGWKRTPSLEIATGELSSQVYGMFTMPDSAVTITAQYKSSTKFQDVPDNAWFAPFVTT